MNCPLCGREMTLKSSRVWSSKAEGPVIVYYWWCPGCYHTVDSHRVPIKEEE